MKRLIGGKNKHFDYNRQQNVKLYILTPGTVGYDSAEAQGFLEATDSEYKAFMQKIVNLDSNIIEENGGVVDNVFIDDKYESMIFLYENESYVQFHCRDFFALANIALNLLTDPTNAHPNDISETLKNGFEPLTARGYVMREIETEILLFLSESGSTSIPNFKFGIGDSIQINRDSYEVVGYSGDDYILRCTDSVYSHSSVGSLSRWDRKRVEKEGELWTDIIKRQSKGREAEYEDLRTLAERVKQIGLQAKFNNWHNVLRIYNGNEHLTSVEIPESRFMSHEEYIENPRLAVAFWGVGSYNSPVYYAGDDTRWWYFKVDVLTNFTKQDWITLQDMSRDEYDELNNTKADKKKEI